MAKKPISAGDAGASETVTVSETEAAPAPATPRRVPVVFAQDWDYDPDRDGITLCVPAGSVKRANPDLAEALIAAGVARAATDGDLLVASTNVRDLELDLSDVREALAALAAALAATVPEPPVTPPPAGEPAAGGPA